MLGKEEVAKVHRLVCQYLSPDYDREFIADGIVLEAWNRGLTTVARIHVRHRCTNAYHRRQRELRRNEQSMVAIEPNTGNESEQSTVDRQQLVGLLVQVLTPTERKVIHMKFYLGKTLEEMVAATNLQREEIQKVIRIALYKMRQEIE